MEARELSQLQVVTDRLKKARIQSHAHSRGTTGPRCWPLSQFIGPPLLVGPGEVLLFGPYYPSLPLVYPSLVMVKSWLLVLVIPR